MVASCAALGFRPTAGEGSPPSTFVRSIDTESEKAVAVVTDPRFEDHDARALEVRDFRRALMNSGLFTEEDVETLSAPISAAMAEMEPREQVRVLAWAHDGIRRYYLYLHEDVLNIVYFRGDVQLDRHRQTMRNLATVTPRPEPKSTATPEAATPTPAPATTPSDSSAPTPRATRTPGATATATATPTPEPAPPPAPRREVATSRLNESEVREKIRELRSLQEQGLITGDEYKRKVKDTLNRL